MTKPEKIELGKSGTYVVSKFVTYEEYNPNLVAPKPYDQWLNDRRNMPEANWLKVLFGNFDCWDGELYARWPLKSRVIHWRVRFSSWRTNHALNSWGSFRFSLHHRWLHWTGKCDNSKHLWIV